MADGDLAIHNLHSSTAFASYGEANKQVGEAYGRIRAYLDEMHISRALVDDMKAVSSYSSRKLSVAKAIAFGSPQSTRSTSYTCLAREPRCSAFRGLRCSGASCFGANDATRWLTQQYIPNNDSGSSTAFDRSASPRKRPSGQTGAGATC